MTPDIGTWILELVKTQGLATLLILGGVLFVTRQVWPAIVNTVLPAWLATRQAQQTMDERQVLAIESIAQSLKSLTEQHKSEL